MKALSIRQPWAWLILHGGKDVENRTWPYIPKLKGQIYIHAAKGMTRDEWEEGWSCSAGIWQRAGLELTLPKPNQLERGGIVGTANIVGYTRDLAHPSPWFMGSLGIILEDPQPCEFRPLSGMLGFFEVP